MSLAKQISKNVRALRERVGLSQNELALRAGISTRYLSQLENGAPNVTVEVIDKLARALSMPATDLIQSERIRAPAGAVQILDQTIRLLKSLRSMIRPNK